MQSIYFRKFVYAKRIEDNNSKFCDKFQKQKTIGICRSFSAFRFIETINVVLKPSQFATFQSTFVNL